MKISIRNGAFETNSSSMHSLVIKKQSEYYTEEEIIDCIFIHSDGSWHLYDYQMEFGRSPFRIINSFRDKFFYMMAALVERYRDESYNELERIAYNHIPGLTKIVLPTSRDSFPVAGSSDSEYGKTEEELVAYLDGLQEKYDMEIDYWTNSDESNWIYEIPFTGYAEDYGMLSKFLDEKKISFEEFLMNKKYVIIQDGDEYGYFYDLKQSGLFNADSVEYEYPEDKDDD